MMTGNIKVDACALKVTAVMLQEVERCMLPEVEKSIMSCVK